MRCAPLVLISFALFGCAGGGGFLDPFPPSDEAGPEPVEEVIETAVAATHAVTLAFAALDAPVTCASLQSGCTTPGCDFEMELDAGSCGLPLWEGASGAVFVSGSRTDADSAMFFASFGGLELAPGEHWFVAGVASMIADRTGDRIRVVYAQQDVEIRADAQATSAELSQHVWTSDATLGETPADPSDDVYTISGGVQDVDAGTGGVEILQAAITGAEVTPACRRNPTAGGAVVERVGAGSSVVLSMLSLSFHAECDGRADITSALGTDMFAIGGTVKMDLQD